MRALTSALAACGLAASAVIGAPALAQDTPATNLVVLPFAVAGHGPSPGVCLAPAPADTTALDSAANSNLPVQLRVAVIRTLAARPGLRVYQNVQDAPPGALIVAGCIERADPGDAAQRLIGMNLGASDLAAHIELYRADQPIRAFDLDAKGANKLPPLGPVGLAVHGVKGMQETLGADAGRLAKLIAERVVAG